MVIEDLIDKFVIWDFSTNDWVDLIHHNQTKIKRSVWPFSSKQIVLCNTITSNLLSQSGTIIRIDPNPKVETSKHTILKLLYFHMPGQLLGPLFKQNLFKWDPSDYLISDKSFYLNLKLFEVLPTDKSPCSSETNNFDTCVRSKALKSTLKLSGCLPPFLNIADDLKEWTKWCSNYSKEEKIEELCDSLPSFLNTSDEIKEWTKYCSNISKKEKIGELAGCLPPFVDAAENLEEGSRHCLDSSEGTKSFETFLQQVKIAKRNCPHPCTSYKANLVFRNKENYMENLRNDKWLGGNHSLYISFPSLVETMQSEELYDWVSYIAEISGWICLCLGLSIPTVLHIFISFFKYKSILVFFKKWSPYMMVILMLLFLTQAWVCLDKFLEKPSGTSIMIEDSELYLKELAISVCMSKKIYELNKVRYRYKFMGNKLSFWQSYSNISNILSSVSVKQNNESLVVLNLTSNKNLFSFDFFPSDDGSSIYFCHSLEIPADHHGIKQLQLTVTDDIIFSIHHKGQLLENAFTSRRDGLYIQRIQTGMTIQGTVYDLSLRYVDLGHHKKDCAYKEENYDKCIKIETCKHMKNSSMSPFCNEVSEEDMYNQEKLFKEYKHHFYSRKVRREKCKIPCLFAIPTLKKSSLDANKEFLSKTGGAWKGTANLQINFPQKITLKKSVVAYSGINLVSEIGGWFGIVLGLSILDTAMQISVVIVGKLTPIYNNTSCQYFTLKMLITLSCYSCVAWQLILCSIRYRSSPTTTSITLADTSDHLTGLALTFCLKGFTQHGFGFESFYTEGNDNGKFLGRVQESIKSLEYQFSGSNTWITSWNQESLDDEEKFTSFVEPYPDRMYCNSWVVPEETSQMRINVANSKNLDIFVHGENMFSLTSMRATLQGDF